MKRLSLAIAMTALLAAGLRLYALNFSSGGGGAAGPAGPTGSSGITALNCINPVDYGADPTGVADSQPALQLATDAMTGTGSPHCMILPAGTYHLHFPWWIKNQGNYMGMGGNVPSSNGGATIIGGNILVTTNIAFNGNTASDAWGGCGSAQAGVGKFWVDPLVGSTGKSMCDNDKWYLELKEGGTLPGSVPASYNYDTQFNGQTQLDAQFWATINTTYGYAGQGIINSQGGDGASGAATYGPLTIWVDTLHAPAGRVTAKLNLSGGAVTATTGGIDWTGSQVHFIEVSYDGSNVRIFVDGTADPAATTAATGTVVDAPYYGMEVGINGAWPPALGGGFHGRVFGLRISNVARNTSDYTAPTGPFTTCDSNTLILLNGTNVQSDEMTTTTNGPFVRPECWGGAATTATGGPWLVEHGGGQQTYGRFQMSGIRINGYQGTALDLNGDCGSDFSDLYIAGQYIGLLVEDIAYFNSFHFVNSTAGNADFMLGWAPEDMYDIAGGYSHYGLVDFGSNRIRQPFFNVATTERACIVSLGTRSPNVNSGETLESVGCDNEGQADMPAIVVTGRLAQFLSSGATGGATSPAVLVGDSMSLLVDNSLITGPQATGLFGAAYGLTPTKTIVHLQNPNFPVGNGGGTSSQMTNFPIVDTSGMHYQVDSMTPTPIAGTTSGTATVACPRFTDVGKTCIANLAAYLNNSATAQRVMLGKGLTALGAFTADVGPGDCSNLTVGAGDNAWCVANNNPYACCTGAGAGVCDTLQFISLPTSMLGSASTEVCRGEGN